MCDENINISDEYRSIISSAIRMCGVFNKEIHLFYNGDYQPVTVKVNNGMLSLSKISIYTNAFSYNMENNMFTNVNEDISMIVTDLARLLDYDCLEQILNSNISIFPPRYFEYIRYNEDRGLLSCIIYKNKPEDAINVLQPDSKGHMRLDIMILLSLLNVTGYNNIDTFRSDNPDIYVC